MTRNTLFAAGVVACGVLASQELGMLAQSATASRARHIPRADIQKGLDTGTSATGIASGQVFPLVPDLVIRRRLAGPNNASSHSTATDKENVTEVVVITDGSGTFMTGGTFVDPATDYAKKDRTKGITGGTSRDVKQGDVIVIPPGTPHWFSKINGSIVMIEARLPVNAPAKAMSWAEVMKEVSASPWGIGGQTYTIVPASGPDKATSVVVRHREKGRPNDASVHSAGTDGVNATEIMIVLEGGGTFMSEGKYIDPNPSYTQLDRAKGITGGLVREVRAGDVLMYPPGTSHWFTNVPELVTMIEVRLPGNVIGAKP